jgi:hypothetical protein
MKWVIRIIQGILAAGFLMSGLMKLFSSAEQIREMLTETLGYRVGFKLIEDFKISAKSLERFPDYNPWISDSAMPVNKYRKLLFSNRYLLIYQIKQSIVCVDYIVDCRQDYRWLL